MSKKLPKKITWFNPFPEISTEKNVTIIVKNTNSCNLRENCQKNQFCDPFSFASTLVQIRFKVHPFLQLFPINPIPMPFHFFIVVESDWSFGSTIDWWWSTQFTIYFNNYSTQNVSFWLCKGWWSIWRKSENLRLENWGQQNTFCKTVFLQGLWHNVCVQGFFFQLLQSYVQTQLQLQGKNLLFSVFWWFIPCGRSGQLQVPHLETN